MARTRHLVGGLVLAVALAGFCRPAAAAEPSAPRMILLHASNEAGMPAEVLDRAKQEVCRIYREIGIEAVWENAVTLTPATYDVPARRLFVSIIPVTTLRVMAVNPAAMGVAVTTSKTRGRLAYILYNRVEQVAADFKTDIAVVLGHAMAHEIGHMLLPAGHSPTGLMRADWTKDDLQQATRGGLLFTEDQGETIRSRLMGNAQAAVSTSDGLTAP
jgi:hypothetical protein